MPLVNVTVNGRAYTVACDDGEEAHVRELGHFLDRRVRELAESVGQVGDSRLLLMAGLVVADELSEARSELDERKREIARLKAFNGHAPLPPDAEDRVAEVLEGAALRIEAIAGRLAHP